ncbi:hypothetical protein [Olsenella sp. HMSC062G07]|uniref:hypothetical protein n=1 Tax=Olsenella sp. HMSC062G07 TaxID=1739330 RepID=UPI0008A2BE94|nr:hypothetical protein [Olsenella sp. HMSC062G07]OFK22491.1 hypothetical protein HMPREF2826_01730 [Olsenella sp. HMSC062G07]
MLKYRYSDLQTANTKIKSMCTGLSGAISKTKAANASFVSVQKGAWAQGESKASIVIESQARIFYEAMSQVRTTFSSLVPDAASVRQQRDTFLTTLGGSCPNGDFVCVNPDAHVETLCTRATSSLDELNSKVRSAQDALSGLKDQGGVPGALSQIHSSVIKEKEQLSHVRQTWVTLATGANKFESTYSSSLKGDAFITNDMVKKVHKTLVAEWDASGEGRLKSFLDSIKELTTEPKVGGHKLPLKYALKAIKEYGKYGLGIVAKPSTALWRLISRYGMSALRADDSLARGAGLEAALVWAIGKHKKGYWKQIGEKFVGDVNLFGQAKEAWGTMRSAFSKGDEAAEAIAGSGSKLSKLARAGKFASGAARAVGVVGDAISVYDIFANSKKAFETTAGDRTQKTAAAMVEGTKGALKFGTGKAVGAIVGTCFGGPVGTAVGIAVGAGADWALGKAADWFQSSGLQQKVTNKVAQGMRAIGKFFKGR